jgi:putative glutamine amidotransferase
LLEQVFEVGEGPVPPGQACRSSHHSLKILDVARSRPIIGVPADRRVLSPHPFHVAGEKYLTAILDGAGCIPLIIPALGEALELEVVLERLDGVLLTGSPSNVEPHHYRGVASRPGTLHDPHRDRTTLPLIPAVIDAGVPTLAICRGFQEMNVAFGGSLHQHVAEIEGYAVHHENPDDPLDVQYGPNHEVTLAEDGLLRRLTGRDRITVNSIHAQGVDRLGRGLAVEAFAPDGLIEAFRAEDAPAFNLAVQWHPEWQVTDNEASLALFRAFGDAAREHARRHA